MKQHEWNALIVFSSDDEQLKIYSHPAEEGAFRLCIAERVNYYIKAVTEHIRILRTDDFNELGDFSLFMKNGAVPEVELKNEEEAKCIAELFDVCICRMVENSFVAVD